MKILVGLDKLKFVTRFRCFIHRLADRHDRVERARIHVAGRAFRATHFQTPPERQHFLRFLVLQARDDSASPPRANDQAILLQPEQGLPNRALTTANFMREAKLGEHGHRFQLVQHDTPLDDSINVVGWTNEFNGWVIHHYRYR
ncbi:hypothetical protein CHELA41_50515 [Hyphomicrobiales bacterium]|nr:hypothetical protein CHELA41_50515 [Hyphomicrobiales bacterium]